MKNLSSLGMTEVVVTGDVKACRLKSKNFNHNKVKRNSN
jgi:hypothetical protein